MKVSEIIQEFVPCEICGNNDLDNFYFYVLANKGSQAYVKCCECGEEYYSTSARSILVSAESKQEEEKKEKEYVYREMCSGSYYRAFTLPSPVGFNLKKSS